MLFRGFKNERTAQALLKARQRRQQRAKDAAHKNALQGTSNSSFQSCNRHFQSNGMTTNFLWPRTTLPSALMKMATLWKTLLNLRISSTGTSLNSHQPKQWIVRHLRWRVSISMFVFYDVQRCQWGSDLSRSNWFGWLFLLLCCLSSSVSLSFQKLPILPG